MKSTLKPADSKRPIREYPYLGRGINGVIVVFTGRDFGTVVHVPDDMSEHHHLWERREFTENAFGYYNGGVILSNEE